ncbi:MAG: hypothetical protein ACI8W8_005069, partial [Rhodothermales bacterium]
KSQVQVAKKCQDQTAAASSRVSDVAKPLYTFKQTLARVVKGK